MDGHAEGDGVGGVLCVGGGVHAKDGRAWWGCMLRMDVFAWMLCWEGRGAWQGRGQGLGFKVHGGGAC